MKINCIRAVETIVAHLLKGHNVTFVAKDEIARDETKRQVWVQIKDHSEVKWSSSERMIQIGLQDGYGCFAVFGTYKPCGAGALHTEVVILDRPQEWQDYSGMKVQHLVEELVKIAAPSSKFPHTFIYETFHTKVY